MSVLLELPKELRSAFKDPFGPVYTDADELLSEVDGPLIAVGDVVTYHLEEAGRTPDVAVVDDKTQRGEIAEEISDALAETDRTVENPAATLTEEMLTALMEALEAEEPVRIFVEGEEDLVALPAMVAAPDGASVVYGQPDEGMVHVPITPEQREEMRDLLSRMDGDVERALSILT